MENRKVVYTTDGEKITYIDKIIGSGVMKDVYFTPDEKWF